MSMPQGLGRYGVEEITDSYTPRSADDNANASFEWYLKNHIGSTMLVFGTYSVEEEGKADLGIQKAAYDYRAFGEQMSMLEVDDKVTENFTGKELDDEIALNYFGARYLDPMLGMWISVDAARQYLNPYLYAGNNPIMRVDPDGNQDDLANQLISDYFRTTVTPQAEAAFDMSCKTIAAGVAVGSAALLVTGAVVAVKAGIVAAAIKTTETAVTAAMGAASKVAGTVKNAIAANPDKVSAIGDFISGLLGGIGPETATGAGLAGGLLHEAAPAIRDEIEDKMKTNSDSDGE